MLFGLLKQPCKHVWLHYAGLPPIRTFPYFFQSLYFFLCFFYKFPTFPYFFGSWYKKIYILQYGPTKCFKPGLSDGWQCSHLKTWCHLLAHYSSLCGGVQLSRRQTNLATTTLDKSVTRIILFNRQCKVGDNHIPIW